MARHADFQTLTSKTGTAAGKRKRSRASALLFAAGNEISAQTLADNLLGQPFSDVAFQVDTEQSVQVIRDGRVELVLCPSDLPAGAEHFAGVFEQKFGSMSPTELSAAITRHESHLKIRRAHKNASHRLVRDVILWLTECLPAMAVHWGENASLFTPTEFRNIAGESSGALAPELMISPRKFRTGNLFHDNVVHGFHAVGARALLGVPVTVEQGPLKFTEAFDAFKTFVFKYSGAGTLPADGTVLCRTAGAVVVVRHQPPSAGFPKGRLLLECAADGATRHNEISTKPSAQSQRVTRPASVSVPQRQSVAPDQEAALRAAMRY